VKRVARANAPVRLSASETAQRAREKRVFYRAQEPDPCKCHPSQETYSWISSPSNEGTKH
jgi:hypothetical protein